MAGAGGEKEAALDQQAKVEEQQDIQAKVATSVADD